MADEHVEILSPGDSFGDYVVERLLGKGGMGVVYLVRAPDGSQFAVKLMHPGQMTHDLRKRFAREAEFAMKIRHKNLISVYDVGEDPDSGFCYIIMDYVSGGTLADLLAARGKLPVAKAVNIVMRIAEALEVAHRNGMVHRDVKPENIMFAEDGTPKLADLGVAKFDDDRKTMVTMTGMIIGTPAYMSPEQLMDSHHIDGRADIYSLGVVLYEMLAGVRPNKGATAVELLAKAIKGEKLPDVRAMSPEVSAAVAYVLSLMCSPDPEKRPQTSIAAAKMLHKAATGELVLPKKTPGYQDAVQNKEKASRKRRVAVFSVLAGLVSLFAAGVAGIWYAVNGLLSVRDSGVEDVKSDSRPEIAERVVVTNLVERPRTAVITNVVEKMIVITNSLERKAVAATAPVKSVSGTEVSVENGEQRKRTKVTDRRVRFSKSGEFTWWYTIENGNASIWRGNRGYNNETKSAFSPSTAVHVEIPSSLDGYKVSGLGCLAFFRCNNMVSVAMPEGLEEIRSWAFQSCRSLREISLPSTVKVVHPGAFCSCGMLREIDFNMATNVEGCIVFCTAVDKFQVSPVNECLIEADGSIYSKDLRTLFLCPRTKESVVIPDSVRRLGVSAFNHCVRLGSVVLPENLREIGVSAFLGCRNLRVVRVECGLEKIGDSCFRGCVNMSAITFPPTLKKIGSAAFADCRNLRKIEFLGDAPELDFGDGAVFGKGLQDCEIVVRRGAKGWTDPATGKLPERWPLPGFDDSLPVRYADEVDSHAPKTDEDRSKDDVPAEWNKGPSDMWFVDWDKAYAEAKRKRKKLFVLNTGPDWCGWCVKLRRDVLDSPEFEKYARKNLVLLYLDNPHHTPMPKEQRAHNRTVCRALGFSGCVPNAGVFTTNGKKLGVIGGGNLMADEYVDRIEKVLDSKGRKVNGDDAKMLFKGRCGKLMEEIAERRAKLPKVAKEDFKAKVTGVALAEKEDRGRYSKLKFEPPETHLTVPFGKTVVFRVEYDFPDGYAARVWTRDEWPDESRGNCRYFGSNPSGLYKGKGVAYGFLTLLDRGRSCELRTLKVSTRSDPELDDAERGWTIGTTPVMIDFKDRNDCSGESPERRVKHVSRDKLHGLYRADDRKHVFVEVCHQHDSHNFSSPRYTLDRVREAISEKAEILFVTLVQTKDGVLFSAEGDNLESISSGKGCPGDYTAAQMRRLRIKSRGRMTSSSFATFEEMLKLGKGKLLFKVTRSLECAEKLGELLDRLDAWESVIFEVWSTDAVTRRYTGRIREKLLSGEILVAACGRSFMDVSRILPECTVDRNDIGTLDGKKEFSGRLFEAFMYGRRPDNQSGWDKALDDGGTVFRTNRAEELVRYLRKRKRRVR